MAAPQRPRLPSGENLPIELVTEILLRLPPREPRFLRSFSVACKAWADAVSEPAFHRRLHQLHGAPPVLGFLHNWEGRTRFVRTTDSPFFLADPPCRSWRVLDCRHGRALFLSWNKFREPGNELLLWEPLTGSQQRVRVPAAFETDYYGAEKMSPTAAVFCAADGCVHHGCHGAPFRLVFVFSVKVFDEDDLYVTRACVYSSQTGNWREPTVMKGFASMIFSRFSSVLVESSQVYFMSDNVLILGYDLATYKFLDVLEPPPPYNEPGYAGRYNIMRAEDGGLGVCQYMNPNLTLWEREASDVPGANWLPTRVIDLTNVLPTWTNLDFGVQVLGFAEEANVIFLKSATAVFLVDLKSERARLVGQQPPILNVIPVVTFYTPVPRGKHHDPLPLGPSEESGCEEGGEEEKTVDQAHQLFDKGSNATKEGGLVNAFECFSHGVEIRDTCYGGVAPECASMEDKHGHALPSEAQEVTDPLGDLPNSPLNEEPVKRISTTSKDDEGNSKTSGSNVEDATPTSERDDFE